MNTTLQAYCRLMRIDKPIGTLLLLWPTLWALWLTGSASVYLYFVFTTGVFIMRSAGCVINDFADRDFDGHVERTKHRPLANKQISEKASKILFVVLVLIAFCLVLTLNGLTISLSFLAMATAFIYPFMKRYTHLPQLVLGIAFSWGIPLAYAATLEAFPLTCWLLCMANICWTVAYDTQYAMVDKQDDLQIGVKSTAILFGQYDKLIIGCLQVVTLVCLVLVGLSNQLSIYFYLSLCLSAGLFIYQQMLMKDRYPAYCFRAFLNNNYVGGIILFGMVLSGLLNV